MNRRTALKGLAAGAASLILTPRAVRAAPLPLDSLDDLAGRFIAASRDEAPAIAAKALGDGAGVGSILGATFLAGIREVRPRYVGGKLHCVMMVESAFQLCEGLGTKEAALTALWNLDDFKRSQQIDEGEGNWVLPPRPEAAFPDAGAARRELVAAMEAWDAERADRAITGLAPLLDHESLFELLWPFAARSYVNIGHKVIYAAQVERVLARIGWRHAEPALRSVVFALLHKDPVARTEAFERSRALAPTLPARWLEGKEDPTRSLEILEKMRASGSEEAQRTIVEAFRAGAGPATIWDGLRLAASEIFLRRPAGPPASRASILPVHAVTVTNAFGHVWRKTKDDSTRRLVVLQAAGWLADLRRDLQAMEVHRENAPALDSLGDAEGGAAPALAESLAAGSAALLRRRLDAHPAEQEECRTLLSASLASRGIEHHQHKYAAAAMEESRLVHPRWASRILAPSAGYLPDASAPEADVTDRLLHALKAHGIA